MRYADVRDHIRTGDVLLCRGTACYSRVIQRWTKSRYSHVGLALRIAVHGIDRVCIIEAMEGSGVRVQLLSDYLARGYAVDWFALDDASINRDVVAQWAVERWGKQYASPRQLLRSFVTAPALGWLGIPTKIDAYRWFCSWFAAEALRAGGWNPLPDDVVAPELASPGDVAFFPCLRRRGPLTLTRARSA